MNVRKYQLAMLVLAMTTANLQAAETTKASLAEVRQAIADQKAVLVDVREKREWDAGHVEGAVFLPLSQLQGKLQADDLKAMLPADKTIYTHCVVGKRSLTAAEILEKHGYKAESLKAGYKELIGAGFTKAQD